MKQSTTAPERPLGAYIKRWCIHHGISQKQFAVGVGYCEQQQVFKLKNVSVHAYFRIVNFMVQNSALPEEFYLSRLKTVIEGKYRWNR